MPLLIGQLPQGTVVLLRSNEFPLAFCSNNENNLVKCSSMKQKLTLQLFRNVWDSPGFAVFVPCPGITCYLFRKHLLVVMIVLLMTAMSSGLLL